MRPTPTRRHFALWVALSAIWLIAASLSVWAWMLSDDLGFSIFGLIALPVGLFWCVLVALLLVPTKVTKGFAVIAILLGIAHLIFTVFIGWPAYPAPYDLPMRKFWGTIAFLASLGLCAVAIGEGVAALRRRTV